MKPKRRAIRINLLASRVVGRARQPHKFTGDATRNTQSSIAERPRAGVPDFRSLGILLRLLGLVCAGALFLALTRVPLADVVGETVRLIGIVAPVMFMTIAVLAAGARWLTRWPLAWVVAFSLLVGIAITIVRTRFEPDPQYIESALVMLLGGLGLWGYLALETRAKSPAFDIARLQALQARIRPHFLFNSLNAVASMVRSEPRKAETALLDLADLYRALMKDNRELTLLSEEVTLASQYLTLEKMRLNERLRVKWYVDNMPQDALVPPLILQPLLENAVYHGIEPAAKGGDVVINIFSRRDQLTMVVSNPFLGASNQHRSRGNNMAVGNIRERLKLHFDVEGSLQNTVRAGTYEVRVTMPYRRASNVPNARANLKKS